MGTHKTDETRSDGNEMPGVFCIEGEWREDLRHRVSVKPVLDLMEHFDVAQTIHRDAATVHELTYYLRAWLTGDYAEYRVLYLATHGDAETIWLSDADHDLGGGSLGLEQLSDILRGQCTGRVICLGGCQVLKQRDSVLQRFLAETKARALVGYRRDVDFTDAAAFEVFVLQALLRRVQGRAIFDQLEREHPRLARQLGLVIASKNQVYRTALRTAAS